MRFSRSWAKKVLMLMKRLDPALMSNVLRVALNNIVKDLDVPEGQNIGGQNAPLPSAKN